MTLHKCLNKQTNKHSLQLCFTSLILHHHQDIVIDVMGHDHHENEIQYP